MPYRQALGRLAAEFQGEAAFAHAAIARYEPPGEFFRPVEKPHQPGDFHIPAQKLGTTGRELKAIGFLRVVARRGWRKMDRRMPIGQRGLVDRQIAPRNVTARREGSGIIDTARLVLGRDGGAGAAPHDPLPELAQIHPQSPASLTDSDRFSAQRPQRIRGEKATVSLYRNFAALQP